MAHTFRPFTRREGRDTMTDAEQLTDGEIARATFWIRRWKMVGGGFIDEASEYVPVQKIDERDPQAEKLEQAGAALLKEIMGDSRKRRHVLMLIEHAAQARAESMNAQIIDHITSGEEPPVAANDEGGPDAA